MSHSVGEEFLTSLSITTISFLCSWQFLPACQSPPESRAHSNFRLLAAADGDTEKKEKKEKGCVCSVDEDDDDDDDICC